MFADSPKALVEALYPDLKRIARDLHWRYAASETMRSTALVNECFLKLRRAHGFVDEQHFLRTAARAMRQILINHAQARLAAKRGGRVCFPRPELCTDNGAMIAFAGALRLEAGQRSDASVRVVPRWDMATLTRVG